MIREPVLALARRCAAGIFVDLPRRSNASSDGYYWGQTSSRRQAAGELQLTQPPAYLMRCTRSTDSGSLAPWQTEQDSAPITEVFTSIWANAAESV